jgi:NHS family xanthosine MFS transporter
MNIKTRLIVMNFLEFFVWGSWLISLGAYMFNVLHFQGWQVGSIYGTMGIASVFTPALFGIVADRWINAERVLGICHIAGAILLIIASKVTDYSGLYFLMLLNSFFFMPTIGLNNTVSYIILEKRGFNIIKDFPPIRVWGTIGFICAMWLVDLLGWNKSPLQLNPKKRKAWSLRWVSMHLYCSSGKKWPYFFFSHYCWARHCRSPIPTALHSSMILKILIPIRSG